MLLGVGFAFRTGFRNNGFTVKILVAGNTIVVFSDGHLNAGLEVRIGKIVGRLAFVGD